MSKKLKYSLGFLLILALYRCGGYNQMVKGDDYEKKQELADKFYNEESWDRAATLYEQIYQRYSRGKIGEQAYFRLGKCTYEMKDYYMGGYYLKNFSSRFSGSDLSEDAAFLSVMCLVTNSPEYSLDQTDTEIALVDLQSFIEDYPYSKLIDSCNNIMDRLRAKLEVKYYESSMLYYKMDNYRAAVAAFDAFLEKFPSTGHRKEILLLAVKSEYLLAINSIEAKKKERFQETIKRYRTFVGAYPEPNDADKDKGYKKPPEYKEIEGYKESAEKQLLILEK